MADLTLALADGVGAALAAPASAVTPGIVVALMGQAEGRGVLARVTIQQGDTLPVLLFMLTDGAGGAYDLDGATVTFRMRLRDAAQGTYKINAACTFVAAGLVRYALQAADVDTAGEFFGELRMVFGTGLVYTSERFVVRVLEGL